MKPQQKSLRRGSTVRQFARDESGATLVELAIVVAAFLFVFFGLIDFGRMGYSWVMAEKAMQRAARIAAVRPAVCTGVPEIHEREPGALTVYENGTSCGPGVCAQLTVTCTGDAPATGTPGAATATEVWNAVAALLPAEATVANIRFTYETDPDLGFLGGPLVPVVTTEIDGLGFTFASPLGGLAQLAGAAQAGGFNAIAFPGLAVSIPGEDLAAGSDG